jgi:hypothetical protein
MAFRIVTFIERAGMVGLFWLLVACQPSVVLSATPTPLPTATRTLSTPMPGTGAGLTEDQAATLNSLEQIDEYPLYTMQVLGAYSTSGYSLDSAPLVEVRPRASFSQLAYGHSWGCSLFATLGVSDQRLYGRNFDWRFSPALLLFTVPSDGYASVSMVDIEYLGYGGDNAKGLTARSVEARRALLQAPELPFDGMNEKGLAVGMAAVPPGQMELDPQKPTIDELMIIREILDHAATVAEAVDLVGRYNIDMGTVPIHYLIASASGQAALVEFYAGERRVWWNEQPWHLATNFLLAAVDGARAGQCPRYDRISQRLAQSEGKLVLPEALSLLADVSQDNTQWSIVYGMTTGDVNVVMGRDYAQPAHTLHLEISRP